MLHSDETRKCWINGVSSFQNELVSACALASDYVRVCGSSCASGAYPKPFNTPSSKNTTPRRCLGNSLMFFGLRTNRFLRRLPLLGGQKLLVRSKVLVADAWSWCYWEGKYPGRNASYYLKGFSGTKAQRLSTICLMATAVQPLLEAKRAFLKVGKALLFELDEALAHKTRSARCHWLGPFFFLSVVWSGHRHRPFHSNISFSSPGFVPGESNAANQRDDNIFHQPGDSGQEPSSLGKNQDRLFILSLRTCGPAFKVYKPVPININYSQTTQWLK